MREGSSEVNVAEIFILEALERHCNDSWSASHEPLNESQKGPKIAGLITHQMNHGAVQTT